MITNTFEIFIPDKKFNLTNNKVIYGVFVLGFIPGLFELFVLQHKETGLFSLITIIFSISSFVTGNILNFFGFFKYRPLRGILEGKIVFENDRIIVNGKTYKISELKKVTFSKHRDYVGRKDVYSRNNFNWRLSQGVDNCIELYLERKVKVIHFLLIYDYHLRDIQEQLICYYKQGKLDWLNLSDVLGISDKNQIQYYDKSL